MTKLFKQEEIDEAALEYSKNAIPSIVATNSKLLNIEIDFRAGVRFAESKVEEIAVEFLRWCGNNRVSLSVEDKRGDFKQCYYQGKNMNPDGLFQQFIKERNENT